MVREHFSGWGAFPRGAIILRGNCPRGNYPRGQLFGGAIIRGAFIQERIIQGAIIRGGGQFYARSIVL